MTSLADLLEEPDDAAVYRIDRLWPTGGNVILAAQRKAGKTTLIGNLVRSLVGGDPFLAGPGPVALIGRDGYRVEPVDGTVALLDLELDRRMMRRWFRDQGIVKPDRVLVESMRGRAALFDVLNDDQRASWAAYLAAAQVRVLIIDPLGALLDAYGLDENSNSDVGPVLAGLDALKDQAGIGELFITHHFGHGPERSRGASKLRGWPDAEWMLVREKGGNGEEPPDAARFLLAEGRDVMIPETRLEYDQATRRLSIAGGNRVQHQATKHEPAILAIVKQTPGASQREILQDAMEAHGISKHAAENAIRKLVRDGALRTERGPRRALRHYLANTTRRPGHDR